MLSLFVNAIYHSQSKNVNDLRNHACVIVGPSTESGIWHLQSRTGSKKAINVKGRIAVNTIYFARQATVSGLGIALLPLPGTTEDLKAGRLKIVLPSFSSITDGIYVTYPSRQHLPAKVRVFLDYVVEKLTPRPPWAIPKN